jgi:hypothetical protein
MTESTKRIDTSTALASSTQLQRQRQLLLFCTAPFDKI